MRQDQQRTPEPVVHVTQRPQFVPQSDGTVRAYYPGEDWHVVGADRSDAIAKLTTEVDRRMQDPAYVAQHFAMAQQHLAGEVTPGFEVRELTRTEYEQRTAVLGDQLRASGETMSGVEDV
jgi:hypothetical protein